MLGVDVKKALLNSKWQHFGEIQMKTILEYKDIFDFYATGVYVWHLFGGHADLCQELITKPYQELIFLTCETSKSVWRFPDVNPLRRTISFSFGC